MKFSFKDIIQIILNILTIVVMIINIILLNQINNSKKNYETKNDSIENKEVLQEMMCYIDEKYQQANADKIIQKTYSLPIHDKVPGPVEENKQSMSDTTAPITTSMPLPNSPTDMYAMMDYRTITDTSSVQWRLQRDASVYTNESGIRCYSDGEREYLLVAMGEVYGKLKGMTYFVTLENGHTFYVMLGEVKGNTYYGHSCVNYNEEKCVNVIEFIVDIDKVPDRTVQLGTFSYQDDLPFNANIQSIEKLQQIWFDIYETAEMYG